MQVQKLKLCLHVLTLPDWVTSCTLVFALTGVPLVGGRQGWLHWSHTQCVTPCACPYRVFPACAASEYEV